jgi:hypothetical protein
LGARFKRPDERQQGGSSSLLRHPGDRLRFGGIGKPCEGKDSRLWQFVSVWQTFGQFSNFVEAFDRPRKFGHALQHRSRSKPIHRTLPSVPRDDQQGVETFLVIRRDSCRQQAPEAAVRATTHAGDCPFEHGGTGQQNLVRHQPSRGLIEQCARTIRACPAQGIKSPEQSPLG